MHQRDDDRTDGFDGPQLRRRQSMTVSLGSGVGTQPLGRTPLLKPVPVLWYACPEGTPPWKGVGLGLAGSVMVAHRERGKE